MAVSSTSFSPAVQFLKLKHLYNVALIGSARSLNQIVMAFELAAQGKSDREVAIALSKVGIHRGHNGKPRVYCRRRAQGADCNCKATFLEIYEAQIEWYMENFVIPEDYQERILKAHRKLEAAYNDTANRRATLENRLARIKELYEWGHKQRGKVRMDYVPS